MTMSYLLLASSCTASLPLLAVSIRVIPITRTKSRNMVRIP
ncbi:hypothetical protein GALL_540080 [mine drainage metagenome]|uniref:Uncharacterized protein n=1 Tax=mine drainage metagenome TaxID=410659 RepID=A0A1J5P071_9ZZZZ